MKAIGEFYENDSLGPPLTGLFGQKSKAAKPTTLVKEVRSQICVLNLLNLPSSCMCLLIVHMCDFTPSPSNHVVGGTSRHQGANWPISWIRHDYAPLVPAIIHGLQYAVEEPSYSS